MSAATEPKRARGRPVGSTKPADQRKTKRMVVLLSEAQDAKADALGGPEWVRRQIDRAKLPG